jgi:hypothetical protein
MIAGIVAAVIVTLIVNEFTDLCPWLADKLVRWSAFRRYRDRERAETRAEELAALIEQRPGHLLKLFTATSFAARTVIAVRNEPDPDFIVRSATLAFMHVVAPIQANNGDTVSVPDLVLGQHLGSCTACRLTLWRARPFTMLLSRHTLASNLASATRGWSVTCNSRSSLTDPLRPYPVAIQELPGHSN